MPALALSTLTSALIESFGPTTVHSYAVKALHIHLAIAHENCTNENYQFSVILECMNRVLKSSYGSWSDICHDY